MRFTANATSSPVAVIGGGRWARAIAGVLGSCGREVILCSPRYAEGWRVWLSALPEAERYRFDLRTNLDSVLHDGAVGSVCVVRAAHDNAQTAIAALRAGKATFVEKPPAVSMSEADRLAAAASGGRCMVGHVMLFASNLRMFADKVASGGGKIRRINIEWHDAKNEYRCGEIKRYDHHINVVQDVLAHIWSIIRLLLPDSPLQLRSAEATHGGRCVRLTLMALDVEISASMQRDAGGRRRMIEVVNGRRGMLDFTAEPGSALVNDSAVDVGTGFFSPLARELRYFLSPSNDEVARRFSDIATAREAVALAATAMRLVRLQQALAIRAALQSETTAEQQESALFALREWIAGERRSAGDEPRAGSDDDLTARETLRWLINGRCGPPPVGVPSMRWPFELA